MNKNKLDVDNTFVACHDGVDSCGYVQMFGNLSELNSYLIALEPEIDSDMAVLYGCLTDAEYIPPSLGDYNVYIIIENFSNPMVSEVIEFVGKSADKLAEIIEELVEKGTKSLKAIRIEDIKILYGDTVTIGMAVDPNEVDAFMTDDIIKSLTGEA